MSVLDRFPHSTAELKRVKTVQFGVLSPDEIVRALSSAIAFATHVLFSSRDDDDDDHVFFSSSSFVGGKSGAKDERMAVSLCLSSPALARTRRASTSGNRNERGFLRRAHPSHPDGCGSRADRERERERGVQSSGGGKSESLI